MSFSGGGSYRIEVKDEATGRVVWSREGVPGSTLMRIVPTIMQAMGSLQDVGGAVGAIGKALGSLRRLGGS